MPVPGVEGKHTWDGGPVILGNVGTYPYYKIRRVSGWGMGDSDDFREAAMGRIGEVPYPSALRGHTFVYEGDIIGLTVVQLRDAGAALRKAFLPRVEGRMDMAYHPGYPISGSYFFEGRCVQLDLPDEQLKGPAALPSGFQRPFIIGIRLSDPRIYNASQQSGQTAAISGASAGMTPPVTPPITMGIGVASGGLDITSTGDMDSDPEVTIYGPVTNPRFENLTIDRALQFGYGYQLASGDTVVVDFKKRTILQGGQDRRSYLDVPESNWWDANAPGVVPGLNSFLLSGDNIANPAKAVVAFNPAH